MSNLTGADLVGKALKDNDVSKLFFLMGGPMHETILSCIDEGIDSISVRHEQAAAMMAHAWSRLTGKPGVCAAASGPAVMNFSTAIATAFIDCVPLVVLGGESPDYQLESQSFQEIDQVACMKPITKWSVRVHSPERIPEYIKMAFHKAMSGKPGPVYLGLPGDILQQKVEEDQIVWRKPCLNISPPEGNKEAIVNAVKRIKNAKKPIIITGSGVYYSTARENNTIKEFVETTGIPLYTTPQGRGIIPDDHELAFPAARSFAFSNADLALVVGTRLNFILGFGKSRFPKENVIRVDIDPEEFCYNRDCELNIHGDAGLVMAQMTEEIKKGEVVNPAWKEWTAELRSINVEKLEKTKQIALTNEVPITVQRLCVEIANFMDRDAIIVVDGQETLNYGRQNIPTYYPAHRLNSGPFGCIGVGIPFGIGAKVAKPDKQVIVFSGDGAFGFNGMDLDTACRFNIPIMVVISNNGGWTARQSNRRKPGRELGFSRYDEMFTSFGIYGEYVERPEDIRPALERAKKKMLENNKPVIVNVKTNPEDRSTTARFYSLYTT